MIIGSHAILYSRNSASDRAMLRDVRRLKHVDAGGGWLIYALPPAALTVHPGRGSTRHELYLMCNSIRRFIREMKGHGLECKSISERRWGLLTYLKLPGGGRLGVYEPRDAIPKPAAKPAAHAKKTPRAKTGNTADARKRPTPKRAKR
jgi:hypothetical protein